jgi:MoxR-like ATPase
LEAMQERQVTIGDETFMLPSPFLVMATQNPIEQEGTYPLPEAQVDRFMLKVTIGYPSKEEELLIIRNHINPTSNLKVNPVLSLVDIERMRSLVEQIYMDDKIERYIVSLIFATRNPAEYGAGDLANYLSFGASPRGSINLAMAAKAHAFLKGRAFVIPDDVQAMATDVLKHRIGLTYEAEVANLKSDDLIQQLVSRIEVP